MRPVGISVASLPMTCDKTKASNGGMGDLAAHLP
jgi:hypothetical protein